MTVRSIFDRLDNSSAPARNQGAVTGAPEPGQHPVMTRTLSLIEAKAKEGGEGWSASGAALFGGQPSAMDRAKEDIEAKAKETAEWLVTQHRDGIIPPAEQIVLDALRALRAIPASERLYADELTDMIAKGYLSTAWGVKDHRRRLMALLRIDAETGA